MGRHPLLESFDTPPLPAEPPGPSEEWLAGHAAGLADAETAFAARQEALSDDIAQSLSDLVFSRAAARANVLEGLQPLFRLLLDRVLPALSRTDFAPQVLALLAESASDDTGRPLRLALHPDQCTAVSPLLDRLPGGAIMIDPDPSLTLHEARITADQGESALDVDRLLDGATRALSAIFDPALSRRYHE